MGLIKLDYLYRYDPARHGYVGRSPGATAGNVVPENRRFLTILQSENDVATGKSTQATLSVRSPGECRQWAHGTFIDGPS
jgi:hypothetical protein